MLVSGTLHVPGWAVSWCGGYGLPVMLGGVWSTSGRPVTVAVSGLVTVAAPPSEVAVTRTAISEPTSEAVTAYVAPVPAVVHAAVTVAAPAAQRTQL